jgi:Arc/MetJ family transcription regulator
MVDEELLEEAVQLSGERTYSRTVERALRDLVRRARAGRILDLTGSGVWEGDLAAMRGDVVTESRGPYRTRKNKKGTWRAPR